LVLAISAAIASADPASPSSHDATLSNRSTPAPAPRIAMFWASLRGDRSAQGIARHDLVLLGQESLRLKLAGDPPGTADGFTAASLDAARARVRELRALNPRMVLLGDMPFYEYPDHWLPEEHPWWLRRDGKRQQFWPGTHLMDLANPDYRRHIVHQTAALKEAGVDGVFYDNLREDPEPWVALLKDVRAATDENWLILANAGYAVGRHDFAAPYLNGFMYESGWSHGRTEWDDAIARMRHSETLLRPPHISVIERFEETRDHAGWPGDARPGQKPADDPAARRWSLCFALTIGDFFYLFSDNTSHRHDWYPEYDRKIGQPSGPGERVSSHVWKRSYQAALVVVNLPGASGPFTLRPDRPSRDTLTGDQGEVFIIPAGDGRILEPL
jgi:hypothetical protein